MVCLFVRDIPTGLKPVLSPPFPPGANVTGVIPGFNTSVLRNLPQSMLLIKVESVLMGFAFLAMIIVRPTLHNKL